MIEIKVGSKGELFLPKELREQLGLCPGDKLYLEVENNIITLFKTPDLLELLNLPPLSKKLSPTEIEKDLEDIQNEQQQLSAGDLS